MTSGIEAGRQLRWILLCAAVLLWSCGKSQELSPLPADAVILAFGDSLTSGTGVTANESYPAVLAGLSGHQVINGGVSGEISADGLRRLPQLLQKHNPALVILCHGGNDILRKLDPLQTQANLEKMIQLAKAHGSEVMLLGVPQPGLILSAAKLYAATAESTGVIYLDDVIPYVLQHADLKSDPVHPNAAGYREMAVRIHAVLQDAGAL